ncbi:ABC transporter substrate-binding protein [Actinocatenispora comari]|uniref:Extracellular solute-binding protein n=1 Tax=Actinocatenispora comari TaxID=2807577 RepID=A0A8J4EN44_9ACTN|nr:extracellular solute-binding protein [Actinocatenispora comari]GIL27309.1 hypothetical protein NUM_25630 [Actinocatenispora comari]
MQTSDTGHSVTRRTVLASALAGAVGLAAAGCARGTQTRPAPGDVVSLFNDNPTWAPGYAAAGKALHQLVGYRLSARASPDTSSYQQIVRMSAQTDSTTDLIKWWNGYRLQDIARSGILQDVSSAWNLAARNGWSNDKELRDSFSYQGKQYGVPLYKSYWAVFYNKPLFAKLKLDVPTDWDEFRRVVAALKAKRITPIASGGATTFESLTWFQQLVNGLDHQFYLDLTAGKASYTDPVCRQAMKLWIELFAAGAFSAPDFNTATVPAQFAQGKMAMHLYGSWNTGAYLSNGVKDANLGLFLLPPPPGGNNSVVVESGVLSVSKKAHKLGAARKVADAWLDPSVQRAWTDFLKDTSADPGVVPKVGAITELAATVRQQKPTQAIRYWEASPPVLIEGNVQDLSAFMINPTAANASRTLSSMQRRADKEWKVWRS